MEDLVKPRRWFHPKTVAFSLMALAVAGVAVVRWRAPAVPPEAPTATAPPRLHVDGRYVTYPGAEVVIGARAGGTVERVTVDENQAVRQGELLLELDATELRARLAEAQARIVESKAALQLARADADRVKAMWQSGMRSTQAHDHARFALERAQAALALARATRARIRAALDKTRIEAPITGTIIARRVQPGETVETGQPLFTLADLARTRVEAEVDEFDAGRVHVGDRARITAEGFPGQAWEGRIEEIPRAVVSRHLNPQDPARPVDTRVLAVKIATPAHLPLKLNQRVEVSIDTARP